MKIDRPATLRMLREANPLKRKRAAIRIRKSREPSLGPHLYEALQREPKDCVNWEIPYHMIMALSEMGYKAAYPYLLALSAERFEATILYTALGDALVRLGRQRNDDAAPLLAIMDGDNFFLVDGAFRAVTLLHLRFHPDVMRQIIHFAAALEDRGTELYRRFCATESRHGLKSPYLNRFMRSCLDDPHEGTRRAAEAALLGRYVDR